MLQLHAITMREYDKVNFRGSPAQSPSQAQVFASLGACRRFRYPGRNPHQREVAHGEI